MLVFLSLLFVILGVHVRENCAFPPWKFIKDADRRDSV